MLKKVLSGFCCFMGITGIIATFSNSSTEPPAATISIAIVFFIISYLLLKSSKKQKKNSINTSNSHNNLKYVIRKILGIFCLIESIACIFLMAPEFKEQPFIIFFISLFFAWSAFWLLRYSKRSNIEVEQITNKTILKKILGGFCATLAFSFISTAIFYFEVETLISTLCISMFLFYIVYLLLRTPKKPKTDTFITSSIETNTTTPKNTEINNEVDIIIDEVNTTNKINDSFMISTTKTDDTSTSTYREINNEIDTITDEVNITTEIANHSIASNVETDNTSTLQHTEINKESDKTKEKVSITANIAEINNHNLITSTQKYIQSNKENDNLSQPIAKINTSLNTNETTISSPQTEYEATIAKMKIPQLVQLINDSYSIMYNTDNPETLCSRYKFACKQIQELKYYYTKGYYANTDCFKLLTIENFCKLTLSCYQKYTDKAKTELKTQKGVQNRIDKFWTIMQDNINTETYSELQKYWTEKMKHEFLVSPKSSITPKEDYLPKEKTTPATVNILPNTYIETDRTISRVNDTSISNEELPFEIQEKKETSLETISSALSTKTFEFSIIPDEVFDLLWIKDITYFHDNKLTIEPSLIDMNLKVKENLYLLNHPLDIGYYPNYINLSPEQKFVYLSWLTNITQPIPIGYVFIFYYGLERHLLYGNFEKAFNMILKLRNYHNNNSFYSYSTDALLIAILHHKRYDLISKINLNKANPKLVQFVSGTLTGGIDSIILIKNCQEVGFTNKRYIKDSYELFKNTLEDILKEKYGTNYYPISENDFLKCQNTFSLVLANYSLNTKDRITNVPDISTNKEYRYNVFEILNQAHEKVKEKKKQLRKNQSLTK